MTSRGSSLALLTDLYQVTMAYGYWREGIADREAVFHHYFRRAPFGGAFAITAGLATAIEWLRSLQFQDDDLAYLDGLKDSKGQRLFDRSFLDYLKDFRFDCDVDAIPEGSVVFANEPLVRVRGGLLKGQLAETALLAIVNHQTLVATKASRVCRATGGDPVLEFGLRRAPGMDGGLSASRAAFIGGCAATSNLLAGKTYGIPVRGTHAHSWVLALGNEVRAFESFARTMPDNCVLLVDTYDTATGIERAVAVGRMLKERGSKLLGIRLDSGDLAKLSITARRMLDEAGLESTAVVASNDLDEYRIAKLRSQGARINVWGVGTSIAAAEGQSGLSGVYKLSMMRDAGGQWQPKAKHSDDPAKASTPGILQVRRFVADGLMRGDWIYDEFEQRNQCPLSLEGLRSETLLRPVLRGGSLTGEPEHLEAARERCRQQIEQVPANVLGPDAGNDAYGVFRPGFVQAAI